MFIRYLVFLITSLFASAALAQSNLTITPLPPGESAQGIIGRVVAAEKKEAQNGPTYIVARETTDMTPFPAIVVYKKIGNLGYWHLPPDLLKFELAGGSSGPGQQIVDKFQTGTIAGMAYGLGVILELHGAGAGTSLAVLQGGLDMLQSIQEQDKEVLRAELDAPGDRRSQIRALGHVANNATQVGQTVVNGRAFWYLAADNMGMQVPASPAGQGGDAVGDVIYELVEIFVDKSLNRVAAIRIFGKGTAGAHYAFQLDNPIHVNPPGLPSSTFNSFTRPIGPFEIGETREDFQPVTGTQVQLPRRKIQSVNFQPGQLDPQTHPILQNMIAMGNEWNLQAAMIRDKDPNAMSASEWDRFRNDYHAVMVPLETAMRMIAEPIQAGIVVTVECAVPAYDVIQLAALLSGQGSQSIWGCSG